MFGGGGLQQPPVFGQQQPATGSAFSFGSPAAGSTPFGSTALQPTGSSLFGSSTAQPGTSGTLFGQQQQQPQSSTLFGAQPTQQQPSTLFGAPQAQPAASSSAFSFSTPTASTGPFGSQPGQPASSSLFGAPATGTSTLFGAQSRPTGSAFSFSTPAAGGSSFGSGGGLFGATAPQQQPTFSLFGQQQAQQQPNALQLAQQQHQQKVDEDHAFYCSIFQCSKFGDERDGVLGKLNYLLASWGYGKGHYSQTLPPVVYTPSNPYYRFKTVSYAFIYTDSNEDGLVILTHKGKPIEEATLSSTLQVIVARPNLLFKVTGSKLSNEESQILVYAEDKSTNRRIPSIELANALGAPQYKGQLDNMGVLSITPKVRPSPEQIKSYLEKPPQGIDPRVWKKAQEDNPDPNSMIPIPLIGLGEIKNRMKWQDSENLQHLTRLKIITESVIQIQNRQSNMTSEISALRRKIELFKHRLLIIIARQEMVRRAGTTLTQEEENLKSRFEELNKRLNCPTEYKGALNELLAQIQLSGGRTEILSHHYYDFEQSHLAQIKEFLKVQQESLKHLVMTLKADLKTQKKLTESINDLNKKITALRKCY